MTSIERPDTRQCLNGAVPEQSADGTGKEKRWDDGRMASPRSSADSASSARQQKRRNARQHASQSAETDRIEDPVDRAVFEAAVWLQHHGLPVTEDTITGVLQLCGEGSR